MKKAIEEKLREIAERENIKILYAAESGSRAWGFASPDSDYDVRFLYMRPRDAYLRLEKFRDVIEEPLVGELDVSGWDIPKALRLLHSSNPTLFEWANSPIVYQAAPEWEWVREEMDGYFSCRAGLGHYLNMAQNNIRHHLHTPSVKWKKYFYALRPLLACRWILENSTPPPVPFEELVKAQLPAELLPVVETLVAAKKRAGEKAEGPRIPELDRYLEEELRHVREKADGLPPAPKKDWEGLDALYLSLLDVRP